ncbi:hypothetical protein D3C86_2069070 [compost metagenome]
MYSLPSALRAIAMPPDAVPVRAANEFMATTSDTKGPPGICRTASRTTAKVGIAATTAPKPTRLAIVRMGRDDEFAPASKL